jgi:Tfp pilus assembly protein PilF
MKKRSVAMTAVLLLAGLLGACRSTDPKKIETQRQFGVRMARMNLWREALFRFNRAVEMNPADAMAHNNLAVAYEANGELENAAREYREAMRLDRSNAYIQKNYSRFVEFTSRNKKRQPAANTTAAGATTGTAATRDTAPAGGTTPPTAAPQPPGATS